MNEYIFYTWDGYSTAPDGEVVENYQVLGFANGETAEEAKQKLLSENSWILDHGFDPENFYHRQVI